MNLDFILAIFKEMRIKQWTKNLFVFAAPLFHGTLFDSAYSIPTIEVFFAFSLLSSGVYFINDIFDVEKDRLDPKKQNRPIAKGAITIKFAWIFSMFLFIVSMLVSFVINLEILYLLFSYFIVNILYTIRLKHILIIDVFIIAYGFLARAFAGAFAANILLTPWFLLCVFFLSIFLALGKRRHELNALEENKIEEGRKVLKFYSIELIDQLTTIVSSSLIICYALFTTDKNTQNNDLMPLTIPLVIYGLFYYLYLVRIKKDGGAPEEILLKCPQILAVVLIYVCVIIGIRNI